MTETLKPESLSDEELEARYPGLREIFDGFLLKGAPPDVQRELTEELGEFPFDAAVVIPDSASGYLRMISRAENGTNQNQNSLHHAEMVAIDKALQSLGVKHLPSEAILLSSVEPCSMCASACWHTGLGNVISGALQSDLRGLGRVINGQSKPFRTEPEGYDMAQFLLERNPGATIHAGYRHKEAVDYILRGKSPRNY